MIGVDLNLWQARGGRLHIEYIPVVQAAQEHLCKVRIILHHSWAGPASGLELLLIEHLRQLYGAVFHQQLRTNGYVCREKYG